MSLIHYNFRSSLVAGTSINIVLPTNFSNNGSPKGILPGVKYQVLWLLHGGQGDEYDFINWSNVIKYAENNKIAVVMPRCSGRWYEGNNFKYITEELPEFLSCIFPFSTKREDNFIGGLSHGGNAALRASLECYDKYAASLVMSAAGVEHKSNTMEFDVFGMAEKALASGHPLTDIIFATGAGTNKSWPEYSAVIYKLKDMGMNTHPYIVEEHSHNWNFWDKTVGLALDELLPIKHDFIWPENVAAGGDGE